MAETVVVIDYGSGNLRSAAKALDRAATDSALARRILVTNKPSDIIKADRILLPGVGAFGACRNGLVAIEGMEDAVHSHVHIKQRPFLGICVGMQLMAKTSYEHGSHAGFGWIDGDIQAIKPSDKSFKIPHMGWNEITLSDNGAAHPVTQCLAAGDHAYFVHSYHMQVRDTGALLGSTHYGTDITAIVGQDNIIGTQFHPEKSQSVGLKFLESFLRWQP